MLSCTYLERKTNKLLKERNSFVFMSQHAFPSCLERTERERARVSLTVAQALTSCLRRDLLPEALGNVEKDREKIKKRQDESFYPNCFSLPFLSEAEQSREWSVKTELMSVRYVIQLQKYYITISFSLWQNLFRSSYLHLWDDWDIIFSCIWNQSSKIQSWFFIYLFMD